MRGLYHRMLMKELTTAQFDMIKTAYLNTIK